MYHILQSNPTLFVKNFKTTRIYRSAVQENKDITNYKKKKTNKKNKTYKTSQLT